MRIGSIIFFLFLNLLIFNSSALGQISYSEKDVPEYQLPDILVSEKGDQINTSGQWETIRRPELLSQFEQHMYGNSTPRELTIHFDPIGSDENAQEGKAVRKQVLITLSTGDEKLELQLLIYLPKDLSAPVPLFVGMNFLGNQSTTTDSDIPLTENYVINSEERGIIENKATENSRGKVAHRWPIDAIIERGYGVATFHCGDIDPDYDDGFQNGLHALFKYKDQEELSLRSTISAWAYGLSKTLDYFETDSDIDHNRIAVIGHSRLGKAALWAGAIDERFAMVISNNSGCGGAALSRRKYGETVARINTSFPHWFSKNFHRYNDNEGQMPIDQHMLMSLIAPRPIYVASAEEDQWADPKGEFLSLYHSGEAYELYGHRIFRYDTLPSTNKAIRSDRQAYHIRSGKHDITAYDWEQYLNFADSRLK